VKSLDESIGVTAALGEAIPDARCAGKVRHAQIEMMRQRVFGIACGYVDGDDAGRMNGDPLHRLLCESNGDLALHEHVGLLLRRLSRVDDL
jgi:hypothetical protein